MPNYYEILEIRSDVARKEVKAAFRKLAKRYHPDYHPDNGEWAHDRMRDILRAYEVLMDDEKRAIYDRTLAHLVDLSGPSRRDNLKRRSDPKARFQLIFLDLLEGRGAEGLARYEELRSATPPLHMEDHMPRGDYLDCQFLLAEEYERQHMTETAFDLYSRLYREDKKYNYFKHFREEIMLRIRNLLVQFLNAEDRLTLAMRGFSEAIEDGIPRRERAFLYKKMAECLCRRGDIRTARLNLLSALLLYPKIGGTKKIRRKLAIDRRGITA